MTQIQLKDVVVDIRLSFVRVPSDRKCETQSTDSITATCDDVQTEEKLEVPLGRVSEEVIERGADIGWCWISDVKYKCIKAGSTLLEACTHIERCMIHTQSRLHHQCLCGHGLR